MCDASRPEPVEQLREIYVRFGISAQYAQNVETLIIGVLKLAERARRPSVTESELADLDARMSHDTLGQLLKELRSKIAVDAGLEERLTTALVIRNRLIHHWFRLNAGNLLFEAGRHRCLADLQAIADHLSGTLEALHPIVDEYFRRIGWSREDVERGLEALMRLEVPGGPDFVV